MRAELIKVRRGVPRPVDLYSAFYISVCCQELPRSVTKEVPTTSSPTTSPLTSPESGENLVAENRRLKLQFEATQIQIAEAREKMLEKSEAFVASQTDNVRNLYQLAQAMREKMDGMATLETCQKELQVYKAQLSEKEVEIHKLHQQIQTDNRLQEKLEASRGQLRQLTDENQQLREQTKLQSLELVQQQLKLDQLAGGGQPSAVPNSECNFVPAQVAVELWTWESKSPATKELFQMYEHQRDLLLLLVRLKCGAWLGHSQFEQLWQQASGWGAENLLAEILARKDLNLSDPYSAFMVLGDLGARVLQYYVGLEHQWLLRHQSPTKVGKRVVNWQDYGLQISSQFYDQSWERLTGWQEVLQTLLTQLQELGFLPRLLAVNLQRLSEFPNADLTGSHYLFYHDKVVDRLSRYIQDISAQKRPLLNLNGQVQLNLPPPQFSSNYVAGEMPVMGSPLTLKYLGKYSNMFDHPDEEPVVTWSAISWLLEDYGLSRTETVPADIQYRRNSRQWSLQPPPAVANHPNFCQCPRRGKWNPAATLTSMEYNWPIIQGPKATPLECHATYRQFFEEHIQHLDPVCYRAAVFSNMLANWCQLWSITIDVNKFSESHHEFLLLLKLQYRPTRWVRLVEAMSITHFITGAHKCLINEFPNTRAGPFERFLRWQRLHAPELVAKDEDLRKAIEKVESRELKRGAEAAAHSGGPPQKLSRK